MTHKPRWIARLEDGWLIAVAFLIGTALMTTQLTAQKSVIATLSSPDVSQSLDVTVKNLEEISKSLLAVSQDTQKIVEGVKVIIDQK